MGQRPLSVASMLIAALAAAACGSDGGAGPSRPAAVTTLGVTKVQPGTGPAGTARPAAPDGGTINVAFVGDVHFEEEVEPYLDNTGGLAPVARMLSGADLAIANLETAITTRGTPEPKKYHFRTPATALEALRRAGVDVVSMANNHAVDYGADGLADTLAATAHSPIPVIGIGRDSAEAFAPYTASIKGRKIAILAATQVPDWTAAAWPAAPNTAGVASARDPQRLLNAVREARGNADVVVVFLHWGTERVGCPTAEQRMLARSLSRAGADIVVGAHAHVLLGAGWLGDTFVDYGLGNFMWYGTNSEREATTGSLTLSIDDRIVSKVDWAPAQIPSGGGVPQAITGSAADAAIARWAGLRSCTGLSARPSG